MLCKCQSQISVINHKSVSITKCCVSVNHKSSQQLCCPRQAFNHSQKLAHSQMTGLRLCVDENMLQGSHLVFQNPTQMGHTPFRITASSDHQLPVFQVAEAEQTPLQMVTPLFQIMIGGGKRQHEVHHFMMIYIQPAVQCLRIYNPNAKKQWHVQHEVATGDFFVLHILHAATLCVLCSQPSNKNSYRSGPEDS